MKKEVEEYILERKHRKEKVIKNIKRVFNNINFGMLILIVVGIYMIFNLKQANFDGQSAKLFLFWWMVFLWSASLVLWGLFNIINTDGYEHEVINEKLDKLLEVKDEKSKKIK